MEDTKTLKTTGQMLKPKMLWGLLKCTFKNFKEHDTATMAAALSYYTVFSIAPILIIVIALAGSIFGREAVQGQIYGEINGFLGNKGAAQVQEIVKQAYHPGKTVVATIIACVLLILGASSVFGQLQKSLNTIWEVELKPKINVKSWFKTRFLSFAMVVGIGFILLVSLVVNAALVGLSNYIQHKMPHFPVLLFNVLDFVVSLSVISLMFAMIYKYLPDMRLKFRDVWVGSFFTALLFTIGKVIISVYIGKTNMADTYGAAGSVVLILVWVYYSSQILFFGAEFTQAYTMERGAWVMPHQLAVRTKKVEIKQGVNESNRDYEAKLEKVADICKE